MGRILGAHGVKGVLRVLSFAATPEDIAAYGPLEDEKGVRRFTFTIVGKARGALLVETEGVRDRDQATALRGTALYLPRAALPPPAKDEFYWDDLVGLQAVLPDGTTLGQVVAVHDYGAGTSLEVRRESKAAVMVPFTNRVVPEVDLVHGRLVVDPPAGLLETPGSESEGVADAAAAEEAAEKE